MTMRVGDVSELPCTFVDRARYSRVLVGMGKRIMRNLLAGLMTRRAANPDGSKEYQVAPALMCTNRVIIIMGLASVSLALVLRILHRGLYYPGWDILSSAQGLRLMSTKTFSEMLQFYVSRYGDRFLVGGLYGVHLLTEEPELFQDYLLGSSSLWFNDYYLAAALEELTAERLAVIGRVYLSVGEEESWEMLKSYDILRSAFQQTGFEAPRLKVEIIPDAGHVGAMPISLYNGFRFLFQSE